MKKEKRMVTKAIKPGNNNKNDNYFGFYDVNKRKQRKQKKGKQKNKIVLRKIKKMLNYYEMFVML